MKNMEWDKEELLNYPISAYFDYLNSKYYSFLKEKLKSFDITTTDFTYLIHIYLREDLSQKDLADLFVVSEANVAKIMRKLEKLGYINRVVDVNNRSRKIINLTEKGCEITPILINYSKEWEREISHNIDEEKLIYFKDVLYDLTYNSSKL